VGSRRIGSDDPTFRVIQDKYDCRQTRITTYPGLRDRNAKYSGIAYAAPGGFYSNATPRPRTRFVMVSRRPHHHRHADASPPDRLTVCGTKTISGRDIGLDNIFTIVADYLAVISSRFGVSIGSTPRCKLANVQDRDRRLSLSSGLTDRHRRGLQFLMPPVRSGRPSFLLVPGGNPADLDYVQTLSLLRRIPKNTGQVF